MRIVVQAIGPGAGESRLAPALAGLAARGHDVAVAGAGAPAGGDVRGAGGRRDLAAVRADLVAGWGSPAALALLARQSGARGMLLGIDVASVAGWSALDQVAWDALPGWALLDAADADAARAGLTRVAHERVALWSEAATAAEPDPTHPDVAVLERAGERALANIGTRAGRTCVFVDRDGTLIVEHGYLSDPERVELLPGVAKALRLLRHAGLPVVVVSNQAGVGRGRFPLARAWATMARLRRLLRAEGVELDAVRFCPHAPDAGCTCRKPGTRLFEEAADDLRLSLKASVMVGDRWLDVAAGQAMGGMGLLLRTGYGREEEARTGEGAPARPADGVFDDLAAAAAWVLERHEAL